MGVGDNEDDGDDADGVVNGGAPVHRCITSDGSVDFGVFQGFSGQNFGDMQASKVGRRIFIVLGYTILRPGLKVCK